MVERAKAKWEGSLKRPAHEPPVQLCMRSPFFVLDDPCVRAPLLPEIQEDRI